MTRDLLNQIFTSSFNEDGTLKDKQGIHFLTEMYALFSGCNHDVAKQQIYECIDDDGLLVLEDLLALPDAPENRIKYFIAVNKNSGKIKRELFARKNIAIKTIKQQMSEARDESENEVTPKSSSDLDNSNEIENTDGYEGIENLDIVKEPVKKANVTRQDVLNKYDFIPVFLN